MGQGWSWSGFADYLFNPYILSGALTTLWLTLASIAGGIWAMVDGGMRTNGPGAMDADGLCPA